MSQEWPKVGESPKLIEDKGGTLEKPCVVYHGSNNKEIEEILTKREKIRDMQEGEVVFAANDLAFASMFILKETNDSWTEKGRFDDVWYEVISDEERFKKADKGGSIYILPSENFSQDLDKSMGEYTLTSKKSVKPINRMSFPSALDAMIDNGVQVYFVKEDIFRQIKNSSDHGLSILRSIDSENKKRGKNIKELPEIDK